MNVRLLTCLVFSILIASPAIADEIGEVDTAFKLLGANHKIVIEAFDDPKVEAATCFLSMAREGGISGRVLSEKIVPVPKLREAVTFRQPVGATRSGQQTGFV